MGYETHLLIAISTFPKYGKFSDKTILEVNILLEIGDALKKYFMDVNSSTKYFSTMFDDLDENMIDYIGSDIHGIRHLQGLQLALKSKHLAKLLRRGVLNQQL